MDNKRVAKIERKTNETDIKLSINLDGSGKAVIDSGIGFFDHMLSALSRFALIDLDINCRGDLYVDGHHTVEDIGICLGQAVKQALGDKQGIVRIGNCLMPMDEALSQIAIDISGRGYLVYHCDFLTLNCGGYDTQLTEEFFRAFALQSGITLHINLQYGKNSHHITEAIFKGVGAALQQAFMYNHRITGVQSTKGVLA